MISHTLYYPENNPDFLDRDTMILILILKIADNFSKCALYNT